MTEAANEVNALRGEPIQILIGKEEVTVLRLSIDDQIEVMDLIQANAEANNKVAIERMVKIVSIAAKRDIDKNAFTSAAQIVGAFNKVWVQNEFDFLLQEVGKVRLKAN